MPVVSAASRRPGTGSSERGVRSSRRSSTPRPATRMPTSPGPLAIVLGSEAEGLVADLARRRASSRSRSRWRGIADSLNVSIAAAVLLFEAVRQRTVARGSRDTEPHGNVRLRDHRRRARPARPRRFEARDRGATVAIIDRLWFGGSCPHIGCLPSKSLLHAAAEHAANPEAYSWERASAARDFMINRPAGAAEPDDSSHVKRLEGAGARCYRGIGPDRRSRARRGPPRRRDPRDRRPERPGRGRIARRRCRRCPGIEGVNLDEPRGDARPGAAEEPGRPRRRPDRLRAVPGLRPLRCAGRRSSSPATG